MKTSVLLIFAAALSIAFSATSGSSVNTETLWLYGKSGLENTTLEVVSIGNDACGGKGYVVRIVGESSTFDVIGNGNYSVGAQIEVGGYLGSSGCGPLPNKYNANVQ